MPPSPSLLSRSLSRWHNTPLYLRILAALALGLVVGIVFGKSAGSLGLPSQLILRLLSALAPPLILIAVIQALMKAEIKGRTAGKLAFLLILNTTVAITIGLAVANVVRPGAWHKLPPPPATSEAATVQALAKPKPVLEQFLDNVPKSVLGPLGDQANVIGVIFIAVAFGLALRRNKDRPLRTITDLVDLAFDTLLTVLHWIIDLVPIGVFGIVASIVGTKGFAPFYALGGFIFAVLLALLLQASYYLLRIRFGSWVRPMDLLRGARDAMTMAFSTSSSTATMPLTFQCLRRVGLREESASMGALVGSNFNNDGTALYEAMSALFVAQMLGMNLDLGQQFTVVITSIIASVGAAGIPEAGLVTMTLVFTAVKLPIDYIPLLLTVDWFLDRSRTVINMMGDMNVSCLLDGKTRGVEESTISAEPPRPGEIREAAE